MGGSEDNSNATVIVIGLASFQEDGCIPTLFEEQNVLSGQPGVLEGVGVLPLRG